MPVSFTTIAAAKPAVRSTEPKSRAPLGADKGKKQSDDRQTRQAAIDDALGKWFSDTMALAEYLSVRYKHQPKYYLEMMFQGGAHMINQHGKPNAYNAFKSIKAAECRERGEPKKAPALHRDYHDEYEALDDDQKQEYVKRYQEEEGEREVKLRRDTPRAKLQDIGNVIRNMKMLMTGAALRVGVEGFFCIVRNTPDYQMAPAWFFTSRELESYMPIATAKRWNITAVGTKIEVFAVAGCDVLNLLRTSRQKADYLKSCIRELISQKIVAITGDENAAMAYVWYEEDVVQRHKIKLVGWTYPELINPSELSTSLPPLNDLHDALKADTCKFVKLDAAEVASRKTAWLEDVAAGRIERKHREERSDKGVKRKEDRRRRRRRGGWGPGPRRRGTRHHRLRSTPREEASSGGAPRSDSLRVPAGPLQRPRPRPKVTSKATITSDDDARAGGADTDDENDVPQRPPKVRASKHVVTSPNDDEGEDAASTAPRPTPAHAAVPMDSDDELNNDPDADEDE
ncbi:hypothetical protein C8R43DRAFT_1122032 [Mycena crocata]|nr:hypothetical protein C8R43DRAFT_1122032 [Mycena crocata]